MLWEVPAPVVAEQSGPRVDLRLHNYRRLGVRPAEHVLVVRVVVSEHPAAAAAAAGLRGRGRRGSFHGRRAKQVCLGRPAAAEQVRAAIAAKERIATCRKPHFSFKEAAERFSFKVAHNSIQILGRKSGRVVVKWARDSIEGLKSHDTRVPLMPPPLLLPADSKCEMVVWHTPPSSPPAVKSAACCFGSKALTGSPVLGGPKSSSSPSCSPLPAAAEGASSSSLSLNSSAAAGAGAAAAGAGVGAEAAAGAAGAAAAVGSRTRSPLDALTEHQPAGASSRTRSAYASPRNSKSGHQLMRGGVLSLSFG